LALHCRMYPPIPHLLPSFIAVPSMERCRYNETVRTWTVFSTDILPLMLERCNWERGVVEGGMSCSVERELIDLMF
jgi:hypothetical protein